MGAFLASFIVDKCNPCSIQLSRHVKKALGSPSKKAAKIMIPKGDK